MKILSILKDGPKDVNAIALKFFPEYSKHTFPHCKAHGSDRIAMGGILREYARRGLVRKEGKLWIAC
jgi:hypothetical protein